MRFAVTILLWGTLLSGSAASNHLGAEDWPRFRGPNGSGVSQASLALPVSVDPTTHLLWRVEVSPALSSPVVSQGRIFLTAHEGDRRVLLCLDSKTGRTLWRRETSAPRREPRYHFNGPATPSPAVDQERVYAFYPDYGLVSYDFAGKQQWKVPLGPFSSQHGLTGSPIPAGQYLVLLIDQVKDSHIAAFDRIDGRPAWKTSRPDLFGGYSTPVVREVGGGDLEIVVSGPSELSAYSVNSGEKVWWFQGMSRQPKAGPLLTPNTVYINWPKTDLGGRPFDFPSILARQDRNRNGAVDLDEVDGALLNLVDFVDRVTGPRDGKVSVEEYRKHLRESREAEALFAIRLGDSGALTKSSVRWKLSRSLPDSPSPLLYGDVLFLFKHGGIVTSVDADTGEVLKRGRIREGVDFYYSSPVAGDDKIYIGSETGKVSVIKAAANWEVLSTTDLGEEIYATPAIADGRLYLRTVAALYAFGIRE